ncbi:rCG59598, isoform CRA_b [Rattus norvegicus]|uniref:Monocarboxylate transporter 2 n=1 Tax=Rattus norvegicus TaxID=10116 RepID=MOT2_RAT|nr:monocarboxylate transporter 2 [Rattus norvegicus]XP_006241494.1 monocarboxylate transporter 2 isoform X1 [Rattus norvegicus]XP_006241495.1 monocarboxylate transporter 2 isoform X1 [Rattus norvegicus]XP_006241496.1 monocarboxylate transporter 2 isoform X1 [Rattus norvegicus]XP_006241497.1 monocarboxylate transporter 2 isoform X1 [Rattus norvegicus]XP_006241498.1 monocarboxylate transporter 2 isoform X1 [Rattus norvegicus]XP_038934539.1 monocarboxylate transporter 2 isoform X1 [Rattus norveg|eukprot:NP_058998.2 monocarboxylate transporter 2 [Rattus norvegicus]
MPSESSVKATAAPPPFPLPPDGGWGWVVVCASFISIGFSYAFPKAVTVFFNDIKDIFKTTSSQIAWISSIMLAVMYAGGPISSVLVNNYGSRPVVIVGGLLCCTGMILASFSSSVIELYLTVGFIGGLGLAFNLQPALTIIGKYFYRKRPLANGFAMAGSPVFLSTLAPFNQFLFNSYGWKGSFLILGAIFLHSCVAGCLMRPVGPSPRAAKSKSKVGSRQDSSTKRLSKVSTAEKINRFLDFGLFTHRGFLIYLSGNVVLFLGMFAPIIFLAPYAKDKGVDDYNSAFLLSVMAFTDMFARPSVGLIANTSLIRPRIQYLFSVAIMFTGICHLLCPLAHSYTALVVYVIFFGIGFGSISSLLFECLMDQVGASRFSSAVGLVTIVECCPVLFGPPLAGKLLDITGQYKYLYIASGIVVLSSGIYLLICNAINYRLLEKERKREKARRKKSASQASKEMEALSRSKQDDVTVKVSNTHNPPSDRDKESSI